MLIIMRYKAVNIQNSTMKFGEVVQVYDRVWTKKFFFFLFFLLLLLRQLKNNPFIESK